MTLERTREQTRVPLRRDTKVARQLWLVACGATTCVPLMNFTFTGLSILCLFLAPAVLYAGIPKRNRLPIALALAGFCAYALSTVVNGVPLLGRDVVVFGAIALYLVAMSLLCNTIADVCALVAGVSFGSIGFYLIVGTALSNAGPFEDLWKYGLAPAVSVCALYVLVMCNRSRLLVVLVLIALAVASLGLNYRSHALICAVTAVLLVFDGTVRRALSPLRTLIFAAIAIAAFSVLLPILSRSGVFGDALRTKVADQSADGVPLILAGRAESPLSLTAIFQKPLLGWGSADNISAAVFDQARRFAIDIGFSPTFQFDYVWRLSDGTVSLHSILLGSWAEGGVVAALLPLWILVSCILIAARSRRAGKWAPVVVFVVIQAGWDIVFSPWSYNLPAILACVATMSALLLSKRPTEVP